MKQRPNVVIQEQITELKNLLTPKLKFKLEFPNGDILCLNPEELQLRQNPENKTMFELSARGHNLLSFNFSELAAQ